MSKTLFLSLDPGVIENASLERRARIQTAILDCAADAIVVADQSGIVYTNPAAKKLLGDSMTTGWSIHLPDGTLCPEDLQPLARAIRGEAFDSEELSLRRPGTADLWVSVSGRLLIDEGAPRGGVVTFRDITERKMMERRLLIADRMASIGTLAAGVAHEVNNPLNILLGNLDLAQEEFDTRAPSAPKVKRFLENARSGGERVKRIVADLRTLSSGSDTRSPVDLGVVISATLVLAGKTLEARARVVREIQPVPRILGNEPRLGQVVLNLLVNAAQAIPEGAAASHEVRIRLHPEGANVVLEVEDTGTGIPPEILPRIFDPFFTTKPVGQGTGLGLWLTRGLISEIGGEISVASVPGKTTFRVLLPAVPDGAAPPSP